MMLPVAGALLFPLKAATFAIVLRERPFGATVALLMATIMSSAAACAFVIVTMPDCSLLIPAVCVGVAILLLARHLGPDAAADHAFLAEPVTLSICSAIMLLLAGAAEVGVASVFSGHGPRFFGYWGLKAVTMLFAITPSLLVTVLIDNNVTAAFLHPVDRARVLRASLAATLWTALAACLVGAVLAFPKALMFSRYLQPPW